MASREGTPQTAAQTPSTTTTTTAPTQTTQNTNSSTSGSQSTSSSQQSATQNMTPENLAQLQNLITALEGGGTTEIKASKAKRDRMQQLIEGLLGSVSTGQAFDDAKSLMALNLQQAMEKNMPAIQRSIEGAGTSASSMQGVLSQQAARDAALSAGALGAQQAAQYAQQRTGLAATLEGITRRDNSATDALVQALNISKGAVQNTQQSGQSNTTSQSNTSGTTTTNNPGQQQTVDYQPGGGGGGNYGSNFVAGGDSGGSGPLPTFSDITYSPSGTASAPAGNQIAPGAYKNAYGVYSDVPQDFYNALLR